MRIWYQYPGRLVPLVWGAAPWSVALTAAASSGLVFVAYAMVSSGVDGPGELRWLGVPVPGLLGAGTVLFGLMGAVAILDYVNLRTIRGQVIKLKRTLDPVKGGPIAHWMAVYDGRSVQVRALRVDERTYQSLADNAMVVVTVTAWLRSVRRVRVQGN